MIRHAATALALAALLLGCREPLDLEGKKKAAQAPAATEPVAQVAPDPEPERPTDPTTLELVPEPESPPATEEECRAAFENLVKLTLQETRRRWEKVGRIWDDASAAEATASVRDNEYTHIAACLRGMTRYHTSCLTSASSVGAWHACTRRRARR